MPEQANLSPAQIWLFCDGDDHWLTRTQHAEDVLAEYMEHFGVTREDAGFYEGEAPRPMTDDELDRYTFTKEDGTAMSFREAMEEQLAMPDTVAPYLFATANY